jgi:hypothetical protein
MSTAAPFILPADEQYDGSNWYAFKERLRAVAEQRGTLDYLDGKIKKPSPPDPAAKPAVATTYWGDDKPSYNEWRQRDNWTKGLITLNVKNATGLGVKTDGTAAEAYDSIAKVQDAMTDIGRLTAEKELARIKFVDGSKMEEHITKLRTAWTKANNQGCEITDSRFRMIILDSLPDSWMIFVSTLRSETTSTSVIACLISHATMMAGRTPTSNSNSAQALATQGRQSRNSDLKCVNPVCGRTGHTIERCFKPGGGMAGQYPDWWKKKGGGNNSGGGTGNTNSNIAASAIADPNYAFATTTQSASPSDQIITYADSAASGYFFVRREDFVEYQAQTESGETANGGEFFIAGIGKVTKKTLFKGQVVSVTFNNAQHTPNLRHNLVSVGRLDQKGYKVVFGGGRATFLNKDGVAFMESEELGNGAMYRLNWLPNDPNTALSARSLTKAADLATWHRRFGHISEGKILAAASKGLTLGMDITPGRADGRCEDCVLGKQSNRPFDLDVEVESEVLQRVYIDLFGPSTVETPGGKRYMMILVDGSSGETENFFLANKEMGTTLSCLDIYRKRAENVTGKKILRLRTDNGLEFKNAVWEEYCAANGIIHEFTAPYTSASNGVAERANRTIMDLARAMLQDAQLPGKYWAEAAATAAYCRNRLPTRRDPETTPFERWHGKKPDVSHIRPFGCVAYAKIPDAVSDGKLAARSLKGALMGYSGTGVYRVLDRATGKVLVTRNVVFEEGAGHRTTDEVLGGEDINVSFSEEPRKTAAAIPGAEEDVEDVIECYSPETAPAVDATVDDMAPPAALVLPEPPAAPAPTRIQRPRVQYPPASRRSGRLAGDDALPFDPDRPLALVTRGNDELWIPQSYQEAMQRPDLWMGPMVAEMAMMKEMGVWKLAERPRGAKVMKSGWTYALKLDADGKLEKRKARFIAKGFSQLPGVHYWESRAAVVRYESLRMTLTVGVTLDMESWQADYTSAFLNAPNQVPCLVEQAPGFEVYSLDDYVGAGTFQIPNPDGPVYEIVGYVPAGGAIHDVVDTPDYQGDGPDQDPTALVDDATRRQMEETEEARMSKRAERIEDLGTEEDVLDENERARRDVRAELDLGLDNPELDAEERRARARNIVCILEKSLYGTVDGAHNWAKTLNRMMKNLGYYRSQADQSVRIRSIKGITTITCTYTDDVTGLSSSVDEYKKAVAELGTEFKLKDLGELRNVIGLGIRRDRGTKYMEISQTAFILRSLKRFGLEDCTPKYTPLPPGLILSITDCPSSEADRIFMADKPYRELLGTGMYLQMATRLDLSQAMASLSRFAENPGPAHWRALVHVFQYLKATSHFKLRYGGTGYDDFTPVGYVDSDYAADTDKRRSISGHVFIQAGGPTAWSAKFQPTVALSTAEAEYMALTRAAQQLEWMYASLAELGLTIPRPAIIRGDNQAAIKIASNQTGAAKVKHIDVREHYIRDRVDEGEIKLEWIGSKDNMADMLTKPLPRVAHWKHCVALRLCEPDDPLIRRSSD